jgi:hypothetical protein
MGGLPERKRNVRLNGKYKHMSLEEMICLGCWR